MKQNTLLVPTDFSLTAYNALDFAIALAKKSGAAIILLHAYTTWDSSFISKTSREEENNKRVGDGLIGLYKSLEYIREKDQGIVVQPLLLKGPVSDLIKEVAKAENCDYVIMGTNGASGLEAAIIGSNTNSIIQDVHCPVFAIPGPVKIGEIKDIICTTDFHSSEIRAIKNLVNLFGPFSVTVTFYNVNPDKLEQNEMLFKFQKNLGSLLEEIPCHFNLSNDRDVLESVENMLYTCKSDLLVTLGRKRAFFERLFVKSKAKSLSLNCPIPFLAYPSES